MSQKENKQEGDDKRLTIAYSVEKRLRTPEFWSTLLIGLILGFCLAVYFLVNLVDYTITAPKEQEIIPVEHTFTCNCSCDETTEQEKLLKILRGAGPSCTSSTRI